jgi:hypothetical protein
VQAVVGEPLPHLTVGVKVLGTTNPDANVTVIVFPFGSAPFPVVVNVVVHVAVVLAARVEPLKVTPDTDEASAVPATPISAAINARATTATRVGRRKDGR